MPLMGSCFHELVAVDLREGQFIVGPPTWAPTVTYNAAAAVVVPGTLGTRVLASTGTSCSEVGIPTTSSSTRGLRSTLDSEP
eukprot:1179544-Rhodomonas_salina.2